MDTTPQHHEFQTEIQQLLRLLIFSLYTKKEIFIRELVSNASDALEKLRFLQLTNQNHMQSELPLEISIHVDPEKSTFSVTDTGIGMSRDDLVANIGTIARSGSLEFVKHLVKEDTETAGREVELIGQFGVGFYSAFMVATEVRVRTRAYTDDAQAWEWRSDGASGYTITETDKAERGTTVEIFLREDAQEFLDPDTIQRIVTRYSNFIAYPIRVNGKQVNEVSAIWTRSQAELAKEDYESFFRWLTGTSEPPASYLHVRSDAPLDLHSVLFIPATNIESLGLGKVEHGLQLYTRKVLIQQECRELLPDYLRFVRGVVDSEDLTLNVSRETVQDDRVIAKLRKLLTKKVLSHLETMQRDRRKDYELFHGRFGRILREGITADFENREVLSSLLLFSSSISDDSVSTLGEYVDRMRDSQEEIYYLAGANRRALDNSPLLEMFRARNVEVLYLFDPVDDFVLSSLGRFRDKAIVSADQADPGRVEKIPPVAPEVSEGEKETLASQSAFDHLLKRFQTVLGDRVKEVRASQRLSDSPCVLVSPGGTPSAQIQNVMSMINKEFVPAKRIFEVNRKHPLIKALARRNTDVPGDEFVDQALRQLYDNALIQEGILPEPADLVPRMLAIMERAAQH